MPPYAYGSMAEALTIMTNSKRFASSEVALVRLHCTPTIYCILLVQNQSKQWGKHLLTQMGFVKRRAGTKLLTKFASRKVIAKCSDYINNCS